MILFPGQLLSPASTLPSSLTLLETKVSTVETVSTESSLLSSASRWARLSISSHIEYDYSKRMKCGV